MLAQGRWGYLAMDSKALHKKKTCPKCGAAIHRSPMRGLLERGILRPVGIRAYRCDGCDQRFLRLRDGDHLGVPGKAQ
jgi:ribosomal protein L40E